MARARSRLPVLLWLAAAAWPTPAGAQAPVDALELLIDVRLERGPSRLMPARAVGRTVYLPAADVFALAELRIASVPPDAGIAAVLEPQGLRIEIRPDSGFLARGTARMPLPADAAFRSDGTLFVDAEILGDLLGVTTTVDLPDLTVVVRSTQQLPAVQRAERERRRAAFARAGPAAPPPAHVERRPGWLGGGVLDWDATFGTGTPVGGSGIAVDYGVIGVGIGVDILGGSTVVLHDEYWVRDGSAANARRTDISWVRAWPDRRWLKQARLGEVQGTGRAPIQIQGAAFTNAPFVRPALFGTAALTGVIPPDWEVEVYRYGSLLGYTTTHDGRFTFDVPIGYGTNPLEVVAYGPTGEVRRYQRTFDVPLDRLPAGDLEYGLSGGACYLDVCAGSANADLRYGLTDRLTLRAGADAFWRDTLPDLWHPYGGVTFQATRSLLLFAEAVANAQVGGRIAFVPTPNLEATVGHTRFATGVDDPILSPAAVRDLSRASLFVRPPLFARRAFLRVEGLRSIGTLTRRYEVRGIVTAQTRVVRLDGGVVASRTSVQAAPYERRVLLTADMLWELGRVWQPLKQTIIRAGMVHDPEAGVERVFGSVSRRLWERYQLEVGAATERSAGLSLQLTFKAALPSARILSQNAFDSTGTRGLQALEGSMLLAPGGRGLSVSDGRSLGRSGVSGTAFLDLDGDGARTPGEPPVAGVRIQIGPWMVETDVDGRFRVWDVVPFEPLAVQVDAGSTPDPQWTPAVLRYIVRPDPNRFVPLDVPFVPTAEVTGEVRLVPDGVPVAGVEVLLAPVEDGPSYTTTTYSDGEFYLLGVRPGVYLVTITSAARDALRLSADEVLIEVLPDQAGPVEGVPLWVRRTSD